MNTLGKLQKNLIIVIPLTMVMGFFFGIKVESTFLKTAIIPLTFLMVYPMMVNLQVKKIFEGGDSKVQFVTQLINFALVPFVAYAVGQFFFAENQYLALGMLLVGLVPTSGMTISWTGMAKGNMPAAVKMTVFGLLLGSFLTPVYVDRLMGAAVDINMLKIFKQIMVIVIAPLILGNITQRYLIKKYGMAHYQEKIKKKIPPFSTLGVVGIVFVAMSLKARGIAENPDILFSILLPLLVLYVVNFAISILAGKLFFKRDNAIALFYGTVMRNLSIALAIAMTAFGKKGADIALVIALGYIIQVQLAAWIVKLTDRIYGPETEADAEKIMHHGVFSLHSTDTLKQAVNLLAEEDIHSVAVLDENKKITGILTMKQAINYIADGLSTESNLGVLSLAPPVMADIHMPVSEIAKTMKRSHECKVLITNSKSEIMGIVTGHDILNNLTPCAS